MAKNYLHRGDVVTLTAPAGGVTSGQGFVSGTLFGVAQYDAAAGAQVEAGLVGCWLLPKPNSAVSFAEGAPVFWDNGTGLCKASATGFYLIGAATVAAGATDATVAVRLNGRSIVAV
jgi:predicted RecA/RadA family phage recombinase